MLIPYLTRRLIFSRSKDRFISFISMISVVGVALGVLALIVVSSVINGFQNELKKVITSMHGDLVMYTVTGPVSDSQDFIKEVQTQFPEVEAMSPVFVSELMLAGPTGVSGAVAEGVQFQNIGMVTELPKKIIQGQLPQNNQEIIVGHALAEEIGAKVGSNVKLILPLTGETQNGNDMNAPRVMSVKVSGIIKMGMHQYDSKFIFLSLETVQNFLQQPEHVNFFKMKVHNGVDSLELSQKIQDAYSYSFYVKDWSQLNKNLFYAIQLEKVVILIILTAIIMVAAFNIVSTLLMMTKEKTQEMAILKAMGMKARSIFRLFSGVGLTIGMVGVFLGILGGIGVSLLLQSSRLISLPSDIYNIDFLPVELRWKEIVFVAFMALGISFLSATYPALKVARHRPIEGLRED